MSHGTKITIESLCVAILLHLITFESQFFVASLLLLFSSTVYDACKNAFNCWHMGFPTGHVTINDRGSR